MATSGRDACWLVAAGAAGMQLGGADVPWDPFEQRWLGEPLLRGDGDLRGHDQNRQTSVFRYARRCSFHTTIMIRRAMRILRAKRYSFAPAMLKPERKSPSIPTVEMVSPLRICAVHKEIIFDLLCAHLIENYPMYRRSKAKAVISNWNEKNVF